MALFFIYPFKILYFLESEDYPSHQFLVSVPKRKFKRATDRNLIKRRVSESYRLNKHILLQAKHQQRFLIGCVYTAKEILPYQVVYSKLKESLLRLSNMDSTKKSY